MDKTLVEAYLSCWQKPDRRAIYEWAAEHVELPNAYAVTGRFDAEKVPFVKGPFDALANPSVREVVCQSSVQSLKTLIGELWLLYAIAETPGPTQWLQVTDDDAKEHAETRFLDLLRSCEAVRRFFSGNRHHQKTTMIIFSHMSLLMEGANNIRNLQRKSIRNQMCSEIWQWKPGHLEEAKARTTQFYFNSKRYLESQAGVQADDMDEAHQSGDQNLWHVACVSCGHHQPLKWTIIRPDGTRAGMRWEDSERTRYANGEWRWSELESTVRYECLKCGFGMRDEPRTRRLLNASGKYVAMNPSAPPSVKSFSWNQLTVEGLSWFGQVMRFLKAKEAYKRGSLDLLREFFQKCLAEPWSESIAFKIDAPPPVVYDVNSEWPEERKRFLTFDVQADCFWVVVRAWSSHESRRLWFGKLYSFDEIRAKQLEFKVQNNCVFGDSGWRATDVYAACCNYGWFALKGEPREHFIHIIRQGKKSVAVRRSYAEPTTGDPERGKSWEGQRFAQLILWSVPTIADRLKALREGKGGFKWLSPMNNGDPMEDEYNRQMSAEYKKLDVDKKTGRAKWIWVCPSRNNHASDCERMQTLAAVLWDILPDLLEYQPVPVTEGTVVTE